MCQLLVRPCNQPAPSLYTTDARRACQEMYAGAKSASDTNRIDLVAPAALRGRALSEPRTCATYRDRVPK